MTKNKRIIGIDYGTKYIGLAISDDNNSFSIPYLVLENNASFFEKLLEIIYDENIGTIVIGYPTTFNGFVSERHRLVDQFANDISDKVSNLDIILQDEAYTTKMSRYIQKDFGLSNSQIKKTKDMSSAALILDAYINMHKNKN